MSNPNNVCIFQGTIQTEPRFIQKKDGTAYASEFYLGAERDYRNKGVFLSDDIPLRMEGEAIMPFAQTLQKGDEVRVVSAYVTNSYVTQNGDKRQKSYFLVSDIKKMKQTSPEIRDGFVELPI